MRPTAVLFLGVRTTPCHVSRRRYRPSVAAIGAVTVKTALRFAFNSYALPAVCGGRIHAFETDRGWLYTYHSAAPAPTTTDGAVKAEDKVTPHPVLVVDFSSSMCSYDFARFADEAVIAYTNRFVQAARATGELSVPSGAEADQAAFKDAKCADLLAFSQGVVAKTISKNSVRKDLEDCSDKLRSNTRPETALEALAQVVLDLPPRSKVATIFLTDGEFNGCSNYPETWRRISAKLCSACSAKGTTMTMTLIGLKNDSISNLKALCDAFKFARPEYVTITTKSEIVPSFVRAADAALAASGRGSSALMLAATSANAEQQDTSGSAIIVTKEEPAVRPDAPMLRVGNYDLALDIALAPAQLMLPYLGAGNGKESYVAIAKELVELAVEAGVQRKDAVDKSTAIAREADEAAKTAWLAGEAAKIAQLQSQLGQLRQRLLELLRAAPDTRALVDADAWMSCASTMISDHHLSHQNIAAMLAASDAKAAFMYESRVNDGFCERALMRATIEKAKDNAGRFSAVVSELEAADPQVKVVVTDAEWPESKAAVIKSSLADLDNTYRCAGTGNRWKQVVEAGDFYCLPLVVNTDAASRNVFWEPGRAPLVAAATSLRNLISHKEFATQHAKFGASGWAAASGMQQSGSNNKPLAFSHAVPLLTMGGAGIPKAVIAAVGKTCATLGNSSLLKATMSREFVGAHIRVYAAVVRSLITQTATTADDIIQSPSEEEVSERNQVLVAVLRTFRELVGLMANTFGAATLTVPELLETILHGDMRRRTFRGGWEAVSVALAATHADYQALAARRSTTPAELRQEAVRRAIDHAVFSELRDQRRWPVRTWQTLHVEDVVQPLFAALATEQWVTSEARDALVAQSKAAVTCDGTKAPLPPIHVDFSGSVGGDDCDDIVMKHVQSASTRVVPPPAIMSFATSVLEHPFGRAMLVAANVSAALAAESATTGTCTLLDVTAAIPRHVHFTASSAAVPTPSASRVAVDARDVARFAAQLDVAGSSYYKAGRAMDPVVLSQRLASKAVGPAAKDAVVRTRLWEMRFIAAPSTPQQRDQLNELFRAALHGEVDSVVTFNERLRDIMGGYVCRALDAACADDEHPGMATSVVELFKHVRATAWELELKPNGLFKNCIAAASSPLFLRPLTTAQMRAYFHPLQRSEAHLCCSEPPRLWRGNLHEELMSLAQRMASCDAFVAAGAAVLEGSPYVGVDEFLRASWRVWNGTVTAATAEV